MSFRIANHSIRMVMANLEDVLKLTLLPYIVICLLEASLSLAFTGTTNWRGNNFALQVEINLSAPSVSLSTSELFGFLLNWALYLPLAAWLAVGWHRFVLAEEYPEGFFPIWNFGRLMPYVFRFLQVIGLALVGIVILVVIFENTLPISPPFALLIAFFICLVLAVLYARISLVLPAISIDRREFGIHASLGATSGANGVILGTILVFFLYLFGLMIIAAILARFVPFLLGSFAIILEWLMLVVGISFLTTLYGVFVEGRSLR